MAEIRKVGVLGAGLMGHGIAQVAAQAGYDVVVREVDDETLADGHRQDREAARPRGREGQGDAGGGRRGPRPHPGHGRLPRPRTTATSCSRRSPRTSALKLEMWRELDEIVKPEALFATNTSSLAVIDQAAVTGRPERFLGLHFFNPAQVMKLLEVVRCVTTSRRDLRRRRRLRRRGSASSACRPRTRPASSSTACSCPTCSTRCAPTRRASARSTEIDEAMKAGAGHPMGPLTLAGLRRARHARLDLRRALRRVPRAPLRPAADPAQDAAGRLVRPQVRDGLLRLLGRDAGARTPGSVCPVAGRIRVRPSARSPRCGRTRTAAT